uniref:Secreted protein n=2 Tax=Ciona intestinalis TaxID=7719 RepID=F6X0A3_CIOIN
MLHIYCFVLQMNKSALLTLLLVGLLVHTETASAHWNTKSLKDDLKLRDEGYYNAVPKDEYYDGYYGAVPKDDHYDGYYGAVP